MILMKFGGTSIEDAEAITRLVTIVRERLALQPVVVSSAMAEVTDTLLQTASIAAKGNATATLENLEHLKARHIVPRAPWWQIRARRYRGCASFSPS